MNTPRGRESRRNGRVLCLVAASLLLAVAAAGCGKASDDDSSGGVLTDQTVSRADLLAQAKKEGSVSLYTTVAAPTAEALAKAFEQEYPGIKVDVFAGNADVVVSKVMSESQAGKQGADVLELDNFALQPLKERGLIQPFHSPAADDLADDLKVKSDKDGENFYVNDRTLYISLGFNTDTLGDLDPTELDDLLDPSLKGKLAFAEGTVAARWVGGVLEDLGDEAGTAFIEKLGKQDIKLAPVTAAALADLLVAGQYAATPSLLSNAVGLHPGAPLEWRPVGTAVRSTGSVSVMKGADSPAAAALLSDFLIGVPGQAVYKAKGYTSPSDQVDFDNWDPMSTYTTSEKFQAAYKKWQGLLDEYVY